MIPTLVKPAEDELFSSWMSFILKLNGVRTGEDRQNFFEAVFHTHTIHSNNLEKCASSKYFPNTEAVCLAEEKDPLFPSLEDALMKHTDIYAMMPFRTMGETAKRTEYCLHDHRMCAGLFGKYRRNKNICPECAKEDEAIYGRQIIHVQHQLYVDVCWKHGCVLQDADTGLAVKDTATKQDMEKAVFMHELFENPIISHYQMLHPFLIEKLAEQDILWNKAYAYVLEEGYIAKRQKEDSALHTDNDHKGNHSTEFLVGASAMLLHDRRSIADVIGTWDPLSEYTHDDFEVINSPGILTQFKCRKCGHVFYMNPVAAEYGSPCPKCSEKMTKADIVQRMAERLNDGSYAISEENNKICIVHAECGNDLSGIFVRNIWKHSGCPYCRKNYMQQKHIGEEKINYDGRLMKVTGWDNVFKVEITFSDGTKIVDRYERFKDGRVRTSKYKDIPTERTGELNVNNQGCLMKIEAYHGRQNVDIVFSDGTELKHRSYRCFQQGQIGYPHYNQKKHEGETVLNNSGYPMTLISYHGYNHVDVMFEDGTIVKNKNYWHFMNGSIEYPFHARSKYLGRTNVNHRGMKMKVIEYNSYKNLVVQFEDGTTVKTTLSGFLAGTTGYPSYYKKKYVGQEQINHEGMKMTIVDYRSYLDITVRFEDGVEVKTNLTSFKKGSTRHPKK